jgi:hypothetical protein
VDPVQQTALAKLETKPRLALRQWLISTGLPRASKHTYGNRVTERQREKATVKDVPIAELHAVQSGVVPEKVAEYIKRPTLIDQPGKRNEHGYLTDMPIVVHYGGKYLVHDGHHRVVAQKLMGAKTVQARVVELSRSDVLKTWAARRGA